MEPFLHHENFDLWPDGSADFHGTIDTYAAQAFTGINAFLTTRVVGMAHGMTNLVPTDVAGTLSEPTLDEGGLCLSGFNASNGANKCAVRLWGYAKLASTGVASIELRASKKSGISATALADDELILGIANDVGSYLVTLSGGGKLTATKLAGPFDGSTVTASGKIKQNGTAGVVCANVPLDPTATAGFLYIPTCAGTPTGTPVVETGTVALVFDIDHEKLYVYDAGAWRGVGLF